MNKQILKDLYQRYTGHQPTDMVMMPGAGSNRKYVRLKGEMQLVGVYSECVEENEAFIYMAAHFKAKGLPVPQVYALSADKKYYLQEDLGCDALFDLIRNGRETQQFHDHEIALLRKTIQLLPAIQFKGAEGMDFSHCYPKVEFNRRSILWDLNYFKYCFLKTTGIDFHEDLLEDDFEKMADVLLQSFDTPTFMYRDFQSRNIMIKEGAPYIIDFQGGRKGPIYYDVASFLWQAKANLTPQLRSELIADYVDSLKPYMPQVTYDSFVAHLRHFVLFRTLQVLGAYGFRGYFEKKAHFIQSVPFAINNLKELLADDFCAYPYLCSLLKEMTTLPQLQPLVPHSGLTVTVMSFSFKKGIPNDASGNGGGYVFDCRSTHNPGKYEPYKQLTGLDEPVIQFLEKDGEITRFLSHVDPIVDAHTQRFIERGFTHLMVCFGCTGGQHRSVYSAQHVAEHLHQKFGVRVHLIHREQHIDKILERK